MTKFSGIIDFMSKHKKGSTFFYTFEILPLEQNEVPEEIVIPKTRLTTDLKKLNVLKKKEEVQKLGSLNEVLGCLKLYTKFKNNRIMVVDDEEFCISSMRAILHSQGINVDYQVDYCINGKEAFN